MTDVEKLLAVEAIKAVKAKYFFGLDHKDWDLWRNEVFASDASLHVPESRDEPFTGIDTIIGWVSASVGDQVSVHHGHMPIIEITSAETATGIWAMEDRLFRTQEYPIEGGFHHLHGFGHYHETYVLTDKGWRISSTKLTRLRVQLTQIA